MTITDADKAIYREARRKGFPVRCAHVCVTIERAARACLTWFGSGTGGHYVVDTDALRTHEPDLDFPDGMTARVRLIPDGDTSADDTDCYSAEDVAAWRRGLWAYYGVEVTVKLRDGRTGEASCVGEEVGPYWIGSEEGQVWHAVTDLLPKAVADADAARVPDILEDEVIRVLREIASDLRRDGDTREWRVVQWVREQLCQDDTDVTGHYNQDLTEVRYWQTGAPGEDGPEDPLCVLAVEITPRGKWAVSASDVRTFTATDYRRRFASPREAVAHFYPEAEVR